MREEEVQNLVERLRGKDAAAPEALYLHISEELSLFLKTKLKDPDDRVDLLHDVFLKTLENLSHLRDPRQLFKWVFKIAKSTLRDRHRDKFKGHRDLDVCSEFECHSDFTKIIEDADRMEFLARSLPPRQGKLLTLIYLHHQDDAEICKSMSLTRNGLKSLKQRMFKNLRSILQKNKFQFERRFSGDKPKATTGDSVFT